ncbi:hypothetical protein BT63DRAFT_216669 [Microthyrium microscopicum]|uniref:Uncharacterized protein n=1 Tax=Microthyrium microscopicum TaxID=703497 RepID=A0A6A6UK33_9PEZI|nr:hypothetical protein BT63DRAFT_216669 [Microthyrium microscopicum]
MGRKGKKKQQAAPSQSKVGSIQLPSIIGQNATSQELVRDEMQGLTKHQRRKKRRRARNLEIQQTRDYGHEAQVKEAKRQALDSQYDELKAQVQQQEAQITKLHKTYLQLKAAHTLPEMIELKLINKYIQKSQMYVSQLQEDINQGPNTQGSQRNARLELLHARIQHTHLQCLEIHLIEPALPSSEMADLPNGVRGLQLPLYQLQDNLNRIAKAQNDLYYPPSAPLQYHPSLEFHKEVMSPSWTNTHGHTDSDSDSNRNWPRGYQGSVSIAQLHGQSSKIQSQIKPSPSRLSEREKMEEEARRLLHQHEVEGPLGQRKQRKLRDLTTKLGPPWLPFEVKKPRTWDTRRLKDASDFPEWYQRLRLMEEDPYDSGLCESDFDQDISELESEHKSECECSTGGGYCKETCKAQIRHLQNMGCYDYPGGAEERQFRDDSSCDYYHELKERRYNRKERLISLCTEKSTAERKQILELERRIRVFKNENKDRRAMKRRKLKQKSIDSPLASISLSEEYWIYCNDYAGRPWQGLFDFKYVKFSAAQGNNIAGSIYFHHLRNAYRIDSFKSPVDPYDPFDVTCENGKFGMTARFFGDNYIKLVLHRHMVVRLLSRIGTATTPQAEMPELFTFVGIRSELAEDEDCYIHEPRKQFLRETDPNYEETFSDISELGGCGYY